jgi:hypothetical protein
VPIRSSTIRTLGFDFPGERISRKVDVTSHFPRYANSFHNGLCVA